MRFKPSVMETLATEIVTDIGNWFTEKKKIECYVLVGRGGNNVAKIQLEASKDVYQSSLTCRVIELNGETVSENERNKKAIRINFIRTVPTIEEQTNVVREALGQFGLPADFYPISDEYAVGKIRIIRLRKKMMENERRDDNVWN